MSLKFKSGDRVLIDLSESEIYEGTLNSICSKSIEIYDILCLTSRIPYEGSMTFYWNEISYITVISECQSSNSDNTTFGDMSVMLAKNCKMNPAEYRRVREMTHYSKILFIDTFDQKCSDIVTVLRNRESIAVVGLGHNSTRTKPLSLLVLADFQQIYIFDLLCLVDLGGVREILESNSICKVVHDGAVLYDCLYHKYGVDTQNIFDTQIVDFMLSQEKHSAAAKRDIKECLTFYFNLPPSLLWGAINDMPEKNWWQRPVTGSERGKAAQLVAYLLPLRDRLMARILQTYTDATFATYTKYKNISDDQMLKFKNG